MGHGYVPDYGKTEACPPQFPASGSIHTVEAFEKPGYILGRYPLALIMDVQVQDTVRRFRYGFHMY